MIAESPALELTYVESGALTMTLSVPVTIGQVDTPDTAGESVEANTEFTLEVGQYIVLTPGTTGEVRNNGDVPGVVSIANIIPAAVGTPAATPAS